MPRSSAVFVLFLIPLAGCGTAANLGGVMARSGPEGRRPNETHVPWTTIPFGGVAQDLQYSAQQSALAAKRYAEGSIYLGAEELIWSSAVLVDVPFSLVGDIVTLPWATHRWTHPIEQTCGQAPPPTHER